MLSLRIFFNSQAKDLAKMSSSVMRLASLRRCSKYVESVEASLSSAFLDADAAVFLGLLAPTTTTTKYQIKTKNNF